MLGLEKEIGIFVRAIVSGMLVYGGYTLIRILRRWIRHNLWMISAEDFLFWVATSFYLFIQIYDTSSGSVRWFFVLGVGVGMVLSAVITSLLGKMGKKIKKSVDKIKKTS